MLLERVKSLFPAYDDLPYYRSLFRGEFSKEDTLRAHLQDLARSVGCQGLREIQLQKLAFALTSGEISVSAYSSLKQAIEDELPGTGRLSHLEVRLQMFEGLGYDKTTLMSVIPLSSAKEATRTFRSIFIERSLLEITAAVGAIESWYVPLAAQLEAHYLSLGYTPRQVATYTLHKQADIDHSLAALSFVSAFARPEFFAGIISAVESGFVSVKLYDEARYLAASDRSRSFSQYLPSKSAE